MDALLVGDAEGLLTMFDIQKQIKLSEYKSGKSIVKSQYWDCQKVFVSCTADGRLILNGFGGKKEHKVLALSKRPIHDFCFLNDYTVLTGSEEGLILALDIRKMN